MQKPTQQRYKYLQNPIVDDYNIRDDDFYRRAAQMKHISAYTNLEAEWNKHFAWLPIRSDITNRLIWLTHYWEYNIKIDNDGLFVPRTGKKWRMIYTREEYIVKKLINE